ncbi:MAG: hypothetical protein J5698_03135 [Bacteroidaceae bacterium]|nr:hypothetical protein [Bacteroidaceae bacterium]
MKKKFQSILFIVVFSFFFFSCEEDRNVTPPVLKIICNYEIDFSPNINSEYTSLVNKYISQSFFVSFENVSTHEKMSCQAQWGAPIDVQLVQGDYIVKAYADVQPLVDDNYCTIMKEASFEVLYQRVQINSKYAEVKLKPNLTCSLFVIPERQDGNWTKVQEFYGKSFASSPHQYSIIAAYDFLKDNNNKCYFAFTKQFANTTLYSKFIHLERTKTGESNTIYGHDISAMYTKKGFLYLYNGEGFKEYEIGSSF